MSILSISLAILFLLDIVLAGHVNRLIRLEEVQRTRNTTRPQPLELRATANPKDNSRFRYLTSRTKEYRVKSLPEFDFDLGEFYSGSIPIDKKDRNLFFAFKPATGSQVNEITIWLNGGPGCSSLSGLIDENGPWTWQPGTFRPVVNPYAWSNLTNMLWVDQPIGTGFSKGKQQAQNEEDIADEFVLWFKNFQKVFGISNYKIYVTGESYAGFYVPYIAQAMISQSDTTYFNVTGGLLYNPYIGSGSTTFDIPAAPFALYNQNLLALNSSTIAQIQALDKKCGYSTYREQHFHFPPPSPQPNEYTYPNNLTFTSCDITSPIGTAASQINPCFNPYSINQQCPLLWDTIGFQTGRTYIPLGATIYFDRPDVKKALHAPLDIEWRACKSNVLTPSQSAPPIFSALPRVIDKTKRFVIASGHLDMVLPTNGTMLSIQNMTWGGKLGFQSRPEAEVIVGMEDLAWGVEGLQGTVGKWHEERGLLWVEAFLAGHMGPVMQPRLAWVLVEWMLGRRERI